MSARIKQEIIPVTVDGQNVIYIRSRMTLGMQTRIADGLKMRPSANGGKPVVGIGEGEALILLLLESISDWEGPDFEEDGKVVPVNAVTLDELDPADPLFLKLREEVTNLYQRALESANGTSPNSPRSKRTTRSTSKQ